MEKKPHFNTGKQHALIGENPLDGRIAFRCPPELKLRAEKVAKQRGISTSRLYVDAIERYLDSE